MDHRRVPYRVGSTGQRMRTFRVEPLSEPQGMLPLQARLERQWRPLLPF